MLQLRERCVVTLSAMLVVELEGNHDVDMVDQVPLCHSVSRLPPHLKDELLALVIKHPQCSTAIFASLLSNDVDKVSLRGLEASVPALLPAWTRQNVGCHLAHLDLSSLTQLQSTDLLTLVHNVPVLEVLNVSYVNAWHDNHTLHVVHQAPHLRELCMEWCQHVTDVSITHITNHPGTRLESLGLTGTTLTSAGLPPLTQVALDQTFRLGVVRLSSCTTLRELTLQDCSRVDALPSPLPKLEGLDIRGLSYVSDTDLLDFLSPVWTNLRKLNLGESNLSTASLAALQTQGICRALQSLDLSWCFELTSDVVAACFPLTPSIHTIKLRCVDIEDSCLDAIGKHCPRLVTLNVARCQAISNAGLAPIYANCRRLQELNVSWTRVSHISIASLLQHCPDVRSVNAQGCRNVRRDLLHSIAKNPSLPNLAYMDLSWVDDVMTSDIDAAIKAHPQLAINGYFSELQDGSMCIL